MSQLRIGWAEIDTTPEGPVDLSGQYYHRVSKGIHSRLSATVLALESETGEVAISVSLDLVAIREDFQTELRAMVALELPDLDVSKLFVNLIHTHNAPAVDSITGLGWLAELPEALKAADYRKFILMKVKTAVIDAWNNRAPAGVASALGFARVGHCRRAVYANGTAEMYGRTDRDDFIGMEGGENSGVDLLFTFDANRRPTGVVLNLACPSQVMEATYQISSDFMGEVRQRLKDQFGESFRTLGQISAAGCQSPRDLTRNYKGEPDFWRADGVVEIGRRLVAAVNGTLRDASARIDFAPAFTHRVKTLKLPRRRATYQDYVAARKNLADLEARLPEAEAYRQFCDEVHHHEKIHGRPGPYDSKLHHFVLIQNNQAVIARYEQQDVEPSFSMELHALRIGSCAWVTNPFELYLDFGDQIKARSPSGQTFIVQLCAGGGGYLPSARAEQLGGYGGLIINGQVGSDGGKMLVDATIQAIAELWP
jgi:hypothetical protein